MVGFWRLLLLKNELFRNRARRAVYLVEHSAFGPGVVRLKLLVFVRVKPRRQLRVAAEEDLSLGLLLADLLQVVLVAFLLFGFVDFVDCIVRTVDVHSSEVAVKAFGQIVEHGLILLFLPTVELLIEADALQVHDVRDCIDFVVVTVARNCPQRVHVAAIPVSVNVSKDLALAELAQFGLFDRFLVEFRSVFVLEVQVGVDVAREEPLHRLVELTTAVFGFLRNVSKANLVFVVRFGSHVDVGGFEHLRLSIALFDPDRRRERVVKDSAEIHLDYFKVTLVHDDDLVASVTFSDDHLPPVYDLLLAAVQVEAVNVFN